MSDNDYVPGAPGESSFNYGEVSEDYTAEDRKRYESEKNPLNTEVDLDTEVGTDFLAGADPDRIEKESSYRQPPPGVHVFQISKFDWLEDGKTYPIKAYIKRLSDGEVRAVTYHSKILRITFCIPGDELCSIRNNFTMAPVGTREELEAYEYGFKTEPEAQKQPREKGGFQAKQLRYFLARLGFQNDANGKLPKEARTLRNWMFYPGTQVKRLIKMEITPPTQGAAYKDKATGEMKTPKPYSNIKFFSYAIVPEPAEVSVARKAAQLAQARANPDSLIGQATEPAIPVQEQAVVPIPSVEPEKSHNGGVSAGHKTGKGKVQV